jgi:hypothetical protein
MRPSRPLGSPIPRAVRAAVLKNLFKTFALPIRTPQAKVSADLIARPGETTSC